MRSPSLKNLREFRRKQQLQRRPQKIRLEGSKSRLRLKRRSNSRHLEAGAVATLAAIRSPEATIAMQQQSPAVMGLSRDTAEIRTLATLTILTRPTLTLTTKETVAVASYLSHPRSHQAALVTRTRTMQIVRHPSQGTADAEDSIDVSLNNLKVTNKLFSFALLLV